MPGFIERIARAILNFFWPRNPADEAYKAATEAFSAYLKSKDPAGLQLALQNFEVAANARREKRHAQLATTLVNYAGAKWAHYELMDRPKADLDEVIALDNEALNIWSQVTPHPKGYPVLLNSLAKAYFDRYRLEISREPFDLALKYYEELKDTAAREDLRVKAQMQMGVMLWTRCELEKTGERLDEGIQHLENALVAVEQAADEPNQATCLYNLASAYEIRHQQFQKPEDLSLAVQYSERAEPLLAKLERAELASCLYNMARQLWVRYQTTRDPAELEKAKATAMKARDEGKPDEKLGVMITNILKAMEQSPRRQETVDSFY